MKYCLFCANFLPNVGGIERYVYNLSKELLKTGNEVVVVTNDVFSLGKEDILEGIKVYRLPCKNLLSGRYPIHIKNDNYEYVINAITEEKFDFAVINARFYIHSVIAAKFCTKNNIPCICIEHGTAHLSVNNNVLDTLGGIYEHFLTSVLKKYCKNYYGVSEAACDWSKHFGILTKGVLYNAVDLEGINLIAETSNIDYRKIFNIPKDSKILAYTGRLIPEKGVLQLCEAFSKLKNKNVYLFIAGDGSLYNELLEFSKLNKNIIFLGKLDFHNVISLLKISDIFCLPSLSEGLPTSVLEAIAMKNYIITTHFGGSKEIIAGENYGTLIESNSSEVILSAIEQVLSDEKRIEICIDKSLNRLNDLFVWAKTAAKLETIAKGETVHIK